MWNPVIVIKNHNHEANPERTECLIAYNEVKSLAKSTTEFPRTIINKVQNKSK
jgi:hypothetical protein